ncbi:MAG: hypothetical protein LWW78_04365 [Deltaproteobacteria bacterium]|nr:hypothetical protein [Deltaproteobacteria bacterium]
MREEVIEEKEIICHSGELPEVAFYSSLYFLTEDPDGPHLSLTPEEVTFLKQGVIERYKWIILRDLDPKMRARSEFRGIERAIVNYKRLKRYAEKEQIDIKNIVPEFAKALISYTKVELEDIYLREHSLRTINCSRSDWQWFLKELGLGPNILPDPDCFFKRSPLHFKETIALFKRLNKEES